MSVTGSHGGRWDGTVLLEERLAVHPVRVAPQRDRPPSQMRHHHLGDPGVVVDHLALGEARLGPQHLVQVGQLELAAADLHGDRCRRHVRPEPASSELAFAARRRKIQRGKRGRPPGSPPGGPTGPAARTAGDPSDSRPDDRHGPAAWTAGGPYDSRPGGRLGPAHALALRRAGFLFPSSSPSPSFALRAAARLASRAAIRSTTGAVAAGAGASVISTPSALRVDQLEHPAHGSRRGTEPGRTRRTATRPAARPSAAPGRSAWCRPRSVHPVVDSRPPRRGRAWSTARARRPWPAAPPDTAWSAARTGRAPPCPSSPWPRPAGRRAWPPVRRAPGSRSARSRSGRSRPGRRTPRCRWSGWPRDRSTASSSGSMTTYRPPPRS